MTIEIIIKALDLAHFWPVYAVMVFPFVTITIITMIKKIIKIFSKKD